MLKKAIKCFHSKAAFCRAIGMKPQFLNQILADRRPLPLRYAIAIEKATEGQVKVEELRPDMKTEWEYMRGPEKNPRDVEHRLEVA